MRQRSLYADDKTQAWIENGSGELGDQPGTLRQVNTGSEQSFSAYHRSSARKKMMIRPERGTYQSTDRPRERPKARVLRKSGIL